MAAAKTLVNTFSFIDQESKSKSIGTKY